MNQARISAQWINCNSNGKTRCIGHGWPHDRVWMTPIGYGRPSIRYAWPPKGYGWPPESFGCPCQDAIFSPWLNLLISKESKTLILLISKELRWVVLPVFWIQKNQKFWFFWFQKNQSARFSTFVSSFDSFDFKKSCNFSYLERSGGWDIFIHVFLTKNKACLQKPKVLAVAEVQFRTMVTWGHFSQKREKHLKPIKNKLSVAEIQLKIDTLTAWHKKLS